MSQERAFFSDPIARSILRPATAAALSALSRSISSLVRRRRLAGALPLPLPPLPPGPSSASAEEACGQQQRRTVRFRSAWSGASLIHQKGLE